MHSQWAQKVYCRDLEQMAYREAWDLQEEMLASMVQQKIQNRVSEENGTDPSSFPVIPNYFLLVEHPPVYTLGKSGKEEHVLIGEEQRQAAGIEFYRTNRGGDITFHGPGQVVGYPLLDLEQFTTDIGKYLRDLEEVIIKTLDVYGLQGKRSPGETGVWLEPDRKGYERKICAMGVRCSRWITMHGFALNVNTPLHYFDQIIPCGIRGKKVTSLQEELGAEQDLHHVKDTVLEKFEEVFEVKIQRVASWPAAKSL
jgi:lipoyl(octanoyl) transferase